MKGVDVACPFCVWSNDPAQHLVRRNRLAAFLQSDATQGALIGSGVIVPIRHAETVFDLTADEVAETFSLLGEVRAWMEEQYHPDGYNLGWNCGRLAGQEIMHAHMHVIPRFAQEPFAGRGIRFWLKQDANRWR